MPGEFFNEIRRAQQEIARKDELAKQEAARKQREREVADQKRQEAQEKEENLRRQKLEAERRVVDLAISKVQVIFQEIMDNSPDIQKAPQKGIQVADYVKNNNNRTISLRWGAKFELTMEERKLINSNEYVNLMGLFRDIPEAITEMDYFSISANVGPQSMLINYESVETQKFNTDWKIGIQAITKNLASPNHVVRILHKGSDYWKKRERPASSSDYSTPRDCCCQ